MAPESDYAVLTKLFEFEFSDEQLAAIAAPLDEPLQVIAGAGSGKTTVMVARIVWAIYQQVIEPGQALGLTFTNKAATEFGNTVASKLRRLDDLGELPFKLDEVEEPLISTYHGFAKRVVDAYGITVGIEPGSTLLEEVDSYKIAYDIVIGSDLPLHELDKSAITVTEYLVDLDQELTEHIVTTDKAREHTLGLIAEIESLSKSMGDDKKLLAAARGRLQVLDLIDIFRAKKAELGVYDFSDLMRHVQRLSLSETVVSELREQYRLVLLDEYQDTSVVQAQFLRALFGDGHSVTAVGDPFQAIYGWRGASELAMSEFGGLFRTSEDKPANQAHLTASRRCAPSILAAANEVAEPLRQHNSEVRPLVSVGGDHKIDSVSAQEFLTDREEQAWVATEIKRLIDADISASNIAVLVRKNDSMRPFAQALGDLGIHSQIAEVGGLVVQPEVVDLLSWMRLVNDPGSNPSLLRILQGPRWRIGARDLALLGRRAKQLATEVPATAPPEGGSGGDDARLLAELTAATAGTDVVDVPCLVDALEQPVDPTNPGLFAYSAEALQRFEEIWSTLHGFQELRSLPLSEFARKIARDTGLESEVMLNALKRSHESGNVAFDPGLAALNGFYDLVHKHGEHASGGSLAQFVNWLDMAASFNKSPRFTPPLPAGTVTFLTVHAAKGLEWDYVFAPETVMLRPKSEMSSPRWITSAGQLPHPLRGDRDVLPALHIDGTGKPYKDFKAEMVTVMERERRRLAYVAFTRAKSSLYVTGHWWAVGKNERRDLSPYLAAVRESIVASGAEPVGSWEPDPGDEHPARLELQTGAWPRAVAQSQLDQKLLASNLVRQAAAEPTVEFSEALTPYERKQVESWHEDLQLLLAERRTRQEQQQVPLPGALSATALLKLAEDQAGYLQSIARPLPQSPNFAADRGTTFHSWVEEHFRDAATLTDVDADVVAERIPDDQLAAYKEFFLGTEYARAVPEAVEQDFDILIGGKVIRGKIDAIFKAEVDGQVYWEVVDWKTNREASADPLQLAIYAAAIERLYGADRANISGTFVYVNARKIVSFPATELPSEADIAEIFANQD